MRPNFLLYIFFLFNFLFLFFNKKNENFHNLKKNKVLLELHLYNFLFNLIFKKNIRAFELIPKFISEFEFKKNYINYNKKILKKIFKNNKNLINNEKIFGWNHYLKFIFLVKLLLKFLFLNLQWVGGTSNDTIELLYGNIAQGNTQTLSSGSLGTTLRNDSKWHLNCRCHFYFFKLFCC